MPATVAVPEVGAISVPSVRTVVVFPAPFGPRKPKTSPWATSKETSEKAVRWPKRLVSRSTTRAGWSWRPSGAGAWSPACGPSSPAATSSGSCGSVMRIAAPAGDAGAWVSCRTTVQQGRGGLCWGGIEPTFGGNCGVIRIFPRRGNRHIPEGNHPNHSRRESSDGAPNTHGSVDIHQERSGHVRKRCRQGVRFRSRLQPDRAVGRHRHPRGFCGALVLGL